MLLKDCRKIRTATLEKKQGMIEQQYAPTTTAKVWVVDKTQFQNSKTCVRQVQDLPQQILVEENSSRVLPEERKTNLDNVIRRRPNICTTERYIQTQQRLEKLKVVPGNNTYAVTLREGKKILMIGDSHIRRVKRDKLQNSFDDVKSFVRYFSGAKREDLHHYIIPSLLKEKPDTVIHVGSNNITHRIFEDFNADKLADELIHIG